MIENSGELNMGIDPPKLELEHEKVKGGNKSREIGTSKILMNQKGTCEFRVCKWEIKS